MAEEIEYDSMSEDTVLGIVAKIRRNASDIRGDWSDPRLACREIWRLCDLLKDEFEEKPLEDEEGMHDGHKVGGCYVCKDGL